MRLVIVDDAGIVHEVLPHIETYDLSKTLARGVVAENVAQVVERLVTTQAMAEDRGDEEGCIICGAPVDPQFGDFCTLRCRRAYFPAESDPWGPAGTLPPTGENLSLVSRKRVID